MKVLIALLAMVPAVALGQAKNTPRPFEDGYIIYADARGTKVGYVQVPEKKRGLVKCNFRESISGVIHETQAEQIVGFGFRGGAVYKAIDFTHDSIPGKFLVKVLVEGNASLYGDNDALILKVQDGTTTELTSSNYRDVLQAATASCAETNKMAPHLRFDREVITDFVKGYNQCMLNDPATFDPFTKIKTVYVGLFLGLESTTLDIEKIGYYPPYSLSDEKHFSVGLLLYIPFAKSRALEFGMIYKPREFNGTSQGTIPNYGGGVRTQHLTINYQELMFPVTLRQTLWRMNKTSIYVSAGASIPVLLSQSSQATLKDTYNTYILNNITKPVTLSKTIQYNLGIGAEIAVSEQHRLLIQTLYFFGPASMATALGSPATSISGNSVYVGYTF